MVHALREAHRVLRPGGILIDLRPAAVHRRVGIGTGRNWRQVTVMQESLDDDRAATRAVREVVRTGLFRRVSRAQFSLDRVADTLEDFDAWLGDFSDLGGAAVRRRLLMRVKSGLEAAGRRRAIAVRAPLMLAVLRKVPGTGSRSG